MRQTQALIQRVRHINAHIQHVELGIDDDLAMMKPGQALLVRQNEAWHPYLREHWWPVGISQHKLIIERPAGVRYEPGSFVNVLGPVGSFFRFRRNLRHVLLLAYDTPPTPLLAMLPMLIANQTSITLVLAGTATSYRTDHLPPQVEVLHSNGDLEWDDRVMSVGLADQVFVVVRPDDEMLRFTTVWHMFSSLRAEIPANYLFGTFQPVLPCGAGACHACMVRLQSGTALACIEGPTFDLTQLKFT